MLKLHKPEKSKMRTVCMTDTEFHYVKDICGDKSISKGVRNLYLVVSALMETTKSKSLNELVDKLNATFKAN